MDDSNSKYAIKPFRLYSNNKKEFIYTPGYSCEIKHKSLSNLLKKLEETTNHITLNDLEKLCFEVDIPSKQVQEILIKTLNILSPLEDLYIPNVAIVSGDNFVTKIIVNDMKQIASSVSHYDNIDDLPKTWNERTQIIYLGLKHSKEKITQLYNRCSGENCFIVTSYLLNDCFIIDNLYNDKENVPNHFENLMRLQQLLNIRQFGQEDWLSFYRSLLDNDIFQLPAIKASESQKALMAGALFQFAAPFLKAYYEYLPQERFLETWCINLSSFAITKTKAIKSCLYKSEYRP